MTSEYEVITAAMNRVLKARRELSQAIFDMEDYGGDGDVDPSELYWDAYDSIDVLDGQVNAAYSYLYEVRAKITEPLGDTHAVG